MNNAAGMNRKTTIPGKILGAYPQRQAGLYMQRIPIFAGQITSMQLRQLAEIAINFTKSTPLHLTTRQDIEMHNIPEDQLNSVQDKLQEIGWATYGAGGDSVRNITVCPCCRFNPDAYDMEPLAAYVKEYIAQSPFLDQLPRKFKISFAGCMKPQSMPYINDLSFLGTSPKTVRVIGAGSLGAQPEAGIILFEQLLLKDVIPLIIATLELFVNHGDRKNRSKARLRHIRQRLGDGVFHEQLLEYYERKKKKETRSDFSIQKGLSGWPKAAAFQTIAGQLPPKHALELAKIAHNANAQLRINLHHGLDIFSTDEVRFPENLKRYLNIPQIVACPGNTTCKRGLVDCPDIAAKLSDLLINNKIYNDKILAISGCPNNCAQSAIADIGLAGRLKTIDGRQQEAYNIMLNGGHGNNRQLARNVKTLLAKDVSNWIRDANKI